MTISSSLTSKNDSVKVLWKLTGQKHQNLHIFSVSLLSLILFHPATPILGNEGMCASLFLHIIFISFLSGQVVFKFDKHELIEADRKQESRYDRPI